MDKGKAAFGRNHSGVNCKETVGNKMPKVEIGGMKTNSISTSDAPQRVHPSSNVKKGL